MSKKIFDIIPPEKISQQNLPKYETFEERKKAKPRIFLKASAFLFAALIVFLVFGFFLFSSAQVKVWPKTRTIMASNQITIDLAADYSDIEEGIIAGKLFEREETFEKEFSSTGKTVKEEKSAGTITVYNEYSTSSRALVPSRFVSADGKLFWSTQKITVPGTRYEGGKLVPGEKEVAVEAAKPGEEYNIGPTTFALPALAGSALYTTIYAKSFSPMSGGYIGEALKVTEEDLKKAEEEIMSSSKKENLDILKRELPEGYILVEESVFQGVLGKDSSKKAEDIAESFNFSVKIKSDAFAFKELDIKALADNLVRFNMNEGENLKEGSLIIDYSFESIDPDSQKIVLNLNIKAKAYKNINIPELKRALSGKSLNEAQIFLSNLEEIEKTELKNRPFLKKGLPKKLEDFEVEMVVD